MFTFFTFLFYFIFLVSGIYSEWELVNWSQKDHDNLFVEKEYKVEEKDLSKFAINWSIGGIYIVTSIVGIFTSQWMFFILLYLIGAIPNWLIKNSLLKTKIEAIITIGMILFIVINRYHIHFNLFDYLFK